jgi:hypothetical protein
MNTVVILIFTFVLEINKIFIRFDQLIFFYQIFRLTNLLYLFVFKLKILGKFSESASNVSDFKFMGELFKILP